MPNIRRFAWLVGLLAGLNALAQAPPDPAYRYDVVSVKKSDPAARGIRIGPGPQGGLRTANTSLMDLLTFAYDVRYFQILDAPGWAKAEGFDVSFTPDNAEVPLKPGEMDAKSLETMMARQRQRMQAVLRDRFNVKLQIETRELPIYALAVAKGGSKLKEPGVAGKGPSMNMNPNTGELTGIGADMRMLTNVLSNILKRPVVDETAIDSTFDMKLQWKPDSFAGGPGAPPPGEPPPADVEGPSIFTAITEQLGLRLVSKKGPVTVYVVKNAERPSDN